MCRKLHNLWMTEYEKLNYLHFKLHIRPIRRVTWVTCHTKQVSTLRFNVTKLNEWINTNLMHFINAVIKSKHIYAAPYNASKSETSGQINGANLAIGHHQSPQCCKHTVLGIYCYYYYCYPKNRKKSLSVRGEKVITATDNGTFWCCSLVASRINKYQITSFKNTELLIMGTQQRRYITVVIPVCSVGPHTK